jgi:hypothetical protein
VADLAHFSFRRILGRSPEATAAAQALLRRGVDWPWRDGWFRRRLEYEAGAITADEFLRHVSDRASRCEAEFVIGVNELSRANRRAAREHLANSVATRLYGFPEFKWARALLAQIDREPGWPQWIPRAEASASNPPPAGAER